MSCYFVTAWATRCTTPITRSRTGDGRCRGPGHSRARTGKAAPRRRNHRPIRARAPVERPVPFAFGEQLCYDVSWSNYLTAGGIVLRVEAPIVLVDRLPHQRRATDDRHAGQPHTLCYKADTLLDVYRLPQRGPIDSREGHRERPNPTTFDHPKRQARSQMKTASLMDVELNLCRR